MNCPVCKSETLRDDRLESNLLTSTCPACGGHWVKADEYWRWREAHGQNLPEKPASATAPLPVSDSRRAKLCPQCGHFLTRFRVGHELPFALDRCANCAGIWFDRNEWEILKSRNLHDEVHFVFSDTWQASVRQAEQAKAFERLLLEKFGEKDLAELRRIKTWIDAHPRAAEIRAFLLDVHTPTAPRE